MLENIATNWVEYSAVILAILGAFSAIARITPNTSDDKIIDTIWKIINKLGLRGGPTE